MLLKISALHKLGKRESALTLLNEALNLTIKSGMLRSFVDSGDAIRKLLLNTTAQGERKDYLLKVQNAFGTEESLPTGGLIEPFSERELEILRLIERGLSNREIGERLYLALNTIKGHNRKIFNKLQVHRRTEAVARARELGLL